MEKLAKLFVIISIVLFIGQTSVFSKVRDIHDSAGLINTDTTITVPGAFLGGFQSNCKVGSQIGSIQQALTCLNDTMISSHANVTIVVKANNMNDGGKTIYVNHPDGSQIHIIGDCGGSSCTLQFAAGQNGFVVDNHHALGLLSDFTIIGNGAANGILAMHSSTIHIGKNVAVDGGFSTGVVATYNSNIYAQSSVISENNNANGFYAYGSSSMYLQNAKAQGNKNCDFYARDTSTLYVTAAQGENTRVCADLNGIVRCPYSTINGLRKYKGLGGLIYPENCKQYVTRNIKK